MIRLLPVLFLLATLLPGLAADPARPNIVIVMPDDIGYGDFACLGNPVIKTPAVDALHAQSVRFTDFHVSPTCAPTRSALLTGRHEFKNGVTHTILERERLAPGSITLAQVLKSAGYSTGIFGKWHLGDEPDRWPTKRGFDEMFIHGGGGIGQTYPGTCGDAPGNMYQDPAILHNGVFEKTKGYCTDLFFSHATDWMRSRLDSGAPFFAMITPNAAHGPLQCPEAYFQRHKGAVADDVAKFYGMIENFDDNLGRLLAKLDEWKAVENTIVIFLTDNGGTVGTKIFNAGMRAGKGTPYQGGTRVPSFWRWPAKWQGGRDVPALTAHLDILPTLMAITGASADDTLKKQIEGRSLLPLLTGASAEWPDRTLVTHVGRWPHGKVADWKYKECSIRDARFTLVNNTELYDLKADPAEKTDVSASHPEELTKLRSAYDAWWQDVQPLLVNEDAPAPAMNPLKALYWKQFGGGPTEAMRKAMDPAAAGERKRPAAKAR